MNKLAKIIGEMSHSDLLKIQKDLKAGNVEKLVKQRIDLMGITKVKMCPVCGGDIVDSNLTLIFGPESFRQKASFDGVDCLKYFLERLQKQGDEEEKFIQKY
jgi:hypothetical protein